MLLVQRPLEQHRRGAAPRLVPGLRPGTAHCSRQPPRIHSLLSPLNTRRLARAPSPPSLRPLFPPPFPFTGQGDPFSPHFETRPSREASRSSSSITSTSAKLAVDANTGERRDLKIDGHNGQELREGRERRLSGEDGEVVTPGR